MQLKAKTTPLLIKQSRMDLLLLLGLEYRRDGLIHFPVYCYAAIAPSMWQKMYSCQIIQISTLLNLQLYDTEQ